MAFQTRAVLAASRKQGPTLTHVLDTRRDVVLCGRVKVENLADVHAHDAWAEATCPTCARKDPRTQGEGPAS